MDNITHSLFGAAIAESVWNLIPEKKQSALPVEAHRALLWTSVIANNIPDLDVFYSGFMHANRQLGNLLHHRGHTHTVPFGLLLGLLIFGTALSFLKGKTYQVLKSGGRGYFAFVALLGPFTHILLDGINNYGVHPFWPWNPSWIYGDLIFVLEPWLWITFSIFLYVVSTPKKIKRIYLSISIAGLGMSWLLGVVPRLLCAGLSVWAVALWLLMKNQTNFRKTVLNWACLSALVACFFWGASKTRQVVLENLSNEPGNFRLEDLSISPLPANPLCWSIVVSQVNDQEYRLRRGLVSPFFHWTSSLPCNDLRLFSSNTQNGAVLAPIVWEPNKKSMLLSELKHLWERYCDVRDFMKFSRAPFFWREGSDLYFSDLRFERSDGRSFSRIQISSQKPPCRNPRAPWKEPRSKLFERSKTGPEETF